MEPRAGSLASLETGIGIPEDSSTRSRFLDRCFFLLLYHAFADSLLLFRRKSNFCEDFSIPYHIRIISYDAPTRSARIFTLVIVKKNGPFYPHFLLNYYLLSY